MGPRSVMASLLLGMHPPRLSSARLVRWCSLFGITENAARVALSRMAERGELRAVEGSYELVGAVRARQSEQDRALAPQSPVWDGSWIFVLLRGEPRSPAERTVFRSAAAGLHLIELRNGVWCRPDNLPRGFRDEPAWSTVVERATLWQARPDRGDQRPGDDVEDVVARFELSEWADRGRVLLDVLQRTTGRLEHGHESALPSAFIAGAAVLQHLRRDPLLPEPLLPSKWPGAELREAYLAYQPSFAGAVAEFLRG